MNTTTTQRDAALDALLGEDDMQTMGILLAEGPTGAATAYALQLIACELRLIRRHLTRNPAAEAAQQALDSRRGMLNDYYGDSEDSE